MARLLGKRDLLSGAMDTHLSMVSNRLNVVMKQLAIIATVFLPLGFLTGFFGQNFSWPILHLQVGFGYWLFLGITLVAIIFGSRQNHDARLHAVRSHSESKFGFFAETFL